MSEQNRDIKSTPVDRFWLATKLEDMSNSQWESLCDGCGKCCLEKLEDEDTGNIYTTSISCRLLDGTTCQCSNYKDRFKYMDDCIKLNHRNVMEIKWLPKTCAYRLVRDGEDLYEWHPLITGDRNSTITSGNSVREFVIHPVQMDDDKGFIDYIIEEE